MNKEPRIVWMDTPVSYGADITIGTGLFSRFQAVCSIPGEEPVSVRTYTLIRDSWEPNGILQHNVRVSSRAEFREIVTKFATFIATPDAPWPFPQQ